MATPSPIIPTTPTTVAQTPPTSATLAELLALPGRKRKREVTHIEGIPVAMVLERPKGGAREVRTPRRLGTSKEVAKTMVVLTD